MSSQYTLNYRLEKIDQKKKFKLTIFEKNSNKKNKTFCYRNCNINYLKFLLKNIQKMEIPTNGFFARDHQVMMGSSATVEIFKKIDKAWAIETIPFSYIHDKPWMHFANGDIANSPQEFVDLIENG